MWDISLVFAFDIHEKTLNESISIYIYITIIYTLIFQRFQNRVSFVKKSKKILTQLVE